MLNKENNNEQNQTPTMPDNNPLLSVQTADPATQNRNYELNGQNGSKDK